MPLYTSELNLLKKELVELRRFNKFYGYEGEELTLSEYKEKNYELPANIRKFLQSFVHEQEKDILSFAKQTSSEIKIINGNQSIDTFSLYTGNIIDDFAEETEDETLNKNYFKADELELLFDKVKFTSYHSITPSREVSVENDLVMKDLDRIFQKEMTRVKSLKSTISIITLLQKINKVYDKIKQNKLSEASVLISRFYNENKQDITLGYLYLEVLYAKAGAGNQKALSKARDVANNVCFLTDKSDESLLNYYRYIYVCREYNYDQERALQIFREFVLIDPERFTSKSLLTQRDGFFLKCLILFLRFDINQWSAFEIETMFSVAHKSLAGGIFYIAFMRRGLKKHLDSVRFDKFVKIEIDLNNIKRSHSRLMSKIKSNYDKNGLPHNSSKIINTIGQQFLKKFFINAKLPDLYEYLTNTSISGVQYLENTENDKKLASIGINEHSFWRAWISKITDETSLQRSDILPIEQVAKEAKLLSKYESIALNAQEYELEILRKEEYKDVKDILPDVTQKGIISVMLGENTYSVFDYGAPWTGIKDYYNNIKSLKNPVSQLGSDLIIKKGKVGLFWNLEELQMMLESLNLIIDNKSLGIQGRLDAILSSKSLESGKNDQYMTLSEHLELYWWLYILLVSLLIFMFNIVI